MTCIMITCYNLSSSLTNLISTWVIRELSCYLYYRVLSLSYELIGPSHSYWLCYASLVDFSVHFCAEHYLKNKQCVIALCGSSRQGENASTFIYITAFFQLFVVVVHIMKTNVIKYKYFANWRMSKEHFIPLMTLCSLLFCQPSLTHYC